MSGHNRVWAQSCVGSIMYGPNRVVSIPRDVPKHNTGRLQQGPPPSDGKEVFDKIIAWRGPVEVDLMATIHNGKVETFVFPLPHPAAAAIDVITVDWNRRNQVYVFPLKTFMMHFLPKLHSYQYHGVLVAPWQPSAPWFPPHFKRAENHLYLRVQLDQFVRSERVFSGFQSYKRWIAFIFLKKSIQHSEVPTVANSLVHAFRKSSINQAVTSWRAFKEWLPDISQCSERDTF